MKRKHEGDFDPAKMIAKKPKGQDIKDAKASLGMPEMDVARMESLWLTAYDFWEQLRDVPEEANPQELMGLLDGLNPADIHWNYAALGFDLSLAWLAVDLADLGIQNPAMQFDASALVKKLLQYPACFSTLDWTAGGEMSLALLTAGLATQDAAISYRCYPLLNALIQRPVWPAGLSWNQTLDEAFTLASAAFELALYRQQPGLLRVLLTSPEDLQTLDWEALALDEEEDGPDKRIPIACLLDRLLTDDVTTYEPFISRFPHETLTRLKPVLTHYKPDSVLLPYVDFLIKLGNRQQPAFMPEQKSLAGDDFTQDIQRIKEKLPELCAMACIRLAHEQISQVSWGRFFQLPLESTASTLSSGAPSSQQPSQADGETPIKPGYSG